MTDSEFQSLIDKIQGMKRGRCFTPYIDYIVFPRYRTIAPKQRIDFRFPLTVLAGRNGTGKSSVLHALFGAPRGKSVANFWFGTAVDPVERGEMGEVEEEDSAGTKKKLTEVQKAAFWYGYMDGNLERQAIKQRVRREKAKAYEDQENWEPTRPNESYGMTPIPREGGRRERHPQIDMEVGYLNLRYLLSAFDRCFNFWSESSRKRFRDTQQWRKVGGSGRPRVQDYIRSRAIRLNSAFSLRRHYQLGTAIFADQAQDLTPGELALISRIVGKEYESGVLLRHRLYDDAWAYSVRFVTKGGQYTEANAGSGETSVVQIVRLFEGAKPNSLLLLDEPETSLHPGAQRELLRYILEQVADKRLQVVLSTHAPGLVWGLPRDAIKVMRRQSDGFVAIDQGLSPEEAFHEIGHPFEPTCNVIVEDRLAKLILEEVAKSKGEGFAAKLRVEYRPGGDSEMKKDIAVFMHGHHRPVFVFDGDQKPQNPHVDPKSLPVNMQTDKHLNKVIKDQIGQEIKFEQNSGMTSEQKGAQSAAYLDYLLRRVFYMPFLYPEQGVWHEDVCRKLLLLILGSQAKADATMAWIDNEANHKQKFALLSESIGHGALHPNQVHAMFVTHFVETRGPVFDKVSSLLDQVIAAAEANDA